MSTAKTLKDQSGEGPEKDPYPDNFKNMSQAEILLRVSDEISSMTTLDEQLGKLIELTGMATKAERGTLFLNDSTTGELYSKVAQGERRREIRILNTTGIAGHVYQTGESLLIADARSDDRFNSTVDETTGFVTRNMLCVPVKTRRGDILGVAQVINKTQGQFTKTDLDLFAAMIIQASVVLQSTLIVERMERNRVQEAKFLEIVAEVSSEIKLGPLLQLIMSTVTNMLHAERSTLFLNDEKTKELYTEIGQGLGAQKIHFPNNVGIAGAVFQSRESVNIPHAYADLRFNPAFDKQTGFFTRSILCVPVINKDGKTIGVTQVLNKKGGPFTEEDEARLKAFTAQIAIGLENAKLFDDVQQMKNYNESVLESMSNGVITFDEHGMIVTCNKAGLTITGCALEEVIGQAAASFFKESGDWVIDHMKRVEEEKKPSVVVEAQMKFNDEMKSVNMTVLPLTSGGKRDKLGTMMLIDDISKEKRMLSTMSRYMDAGVADKLMKGGEELLGGLSSEATVLFSDIRSFTTLSESLGPQGTVGLLNEYFTLMVDCIQVEGGMLDKFIGDAIMAIFGTPFAHDDDEDRGLRSAIEMMKELARFNRERIERNPKALQVDIGIGLNTDQVVSGNIGSPKRMDYTVIGDGVNLAARLESACKQYGANILISEYTFAKLKNTYHTREVDRVIVKGKTKPVIIYEVLDFHTPESFPNRVDVLGNFRNGVELYRNGDFQKAMDCFNQGIALHPEDQAAKMYVERCKVLMKKTPKDWDGVWVMTSK